MKLRYPQHPLCPLCKKGYLALRGCKQKCMTKESRVDPTQKCFTLWGCEHCYAGFDSESKHDAYTKLKM